MFSMENNYIGLTHSLANNNNIAIVLQTAFKILLLTMHHRKKYKKIIINSYSKIFTFCFRIFLKKCTRYCHFNRKHLKYIESFAKIFKSFE